VVRKSCFPQLVVGDVQGRKFVKEMHIPHSKNIHIGCTYIYIYIVLLLLLIVIRRYLLTLQRPL